MPGRWPSSAMPAHVNDSGRFQQRASMRPRSLRSTSGRHRARRPVVVSSRSGRMRPLVINSRTRSAALAANRRSVARATSGSPVTTALHGSAAQRARARRPASPGSRASPGAVHPGRGSPDPGDGDEPGPSGVAGSSSSSGEAVGPAAPPGSRRSSSTSSALTIRSSASTPPTSAAARRMPSWPRANGCGTGRRCRGGRPRRGAAVRGPLPSSAHTTRRSASISQAEWRTRTLASCPTL